jgi:hypothetical protein
MAESIRGNGIWSLQAAQKDLVVQAGFNPNDFEIKNGFLMYKKREIDLSHCFDQHLIVGMEGVEQKEIDLINLVDAFSTVVGYKPFCTYSLEIPTTTNSRTFQKYEWAKNDIDKRIEELKIMSDVTGLLRLT